MIKQICTLYTFISVSLKINLLYKILQYFKYNINLYKNLPDTNKVQYLIIYILNSERSARSLHLKCP